MPDWNSYFRLVRTGLILTVGLLVGGCGMLGFRSWNWHQKLSISVITPDGMRVGSSVRGITVEKYPEWWGVGDSSGSSGGSLTGEAAVVDLGSGHFLFALLRGAVDVNSEMTFFPEPKKPRLWGDLEPLYDWLVTVRETRELPLELYPMLVSFDDLKVPSSVKLVDAKDLAATFGDGYRLDKIQIAITDEHVTKGNLQVLLPWLCSYRNNGMRLSGLKGAISDNTLPNNLDAADFARGKCK